MPQNVSLHYNTHLKYEYLILFYFLFVENYERLEADKKKQVHKKRRFEGPTIRYHSVLMPLVSHSVLKEENVDVEGCVLSPAEHILLQK